MSNVAHSTLIDILDFLRREKIRFCFVPNLYKIFVHKLKMNQIGQIPLVQEEENEVHTPYLYIKKYFDLILALIAAILLLPLFLVIYVAIKMDSRGPVFFMHDRVGKDGKIFRMYKFRSMFTDVEPYAVNPLDQRDPRITGVGRFLRRMSLDELPQIINVLKGEMSLVGPRPEMPFIVAGYDEIHKERLKVLPGITGLWQLSGDRKKAIHENMDYDLYYIRNMSFFLDMAILIETFIFAFRGI
jgi:exopolysaccharide biosynthesis polyprenyl glycosylphosphotransferase